MLEFRNVTKKQGKFCLKDISFQLEEGYLLGILGKNGAGKSTLLNCMLESSGKYQGEIFYQGKNIREEHQWFLGKCAYIADDNQFFRLKTGIENVDLLGRFYEEMDRDKFIQYMKNMDLSWRKNIGAMSRGEFIRFQLAFGRAHNAKIYLLDEATAGMDPVFRREFYNILRDILAEESMVIMTTHIQSDINRNMDYICRLEQGSIRFYGENPGGKEDEEFQGNNKSL